VLQVKCGEVRHGLLSGFETARNECQVLITTVLTANGFEYSLFLMLRGALKIDEPLIRTELRWIDYEPASCLFRSIALSICLIS